MNTTTLELDRTGPQHSFARRSAYDWIFALVTVGGGIYAFSRYGASMDGYEKAILLGALPAGVALGWFWGSLRTLMLAVAVAALLAIGLYGQATDAYGADLAKGEQSSPEFLALSPLGRVPTLIVEGEAVTEVPALLAYIAAALFARPDWAAVLRGTLIPTIELTPQYIGILVALIGTTISPYLFFWQASQEVDEQIAMGRRRLWQRQGASRTELRYALADNVSGMVFSSVVAYFIILASGATLFVSGQHTIGTATDAAVEGGVAAGSVAAAVWAGQLPPVPARYLPRGGGAGRRRHRRARGRPGSSRSRRSCRRCRRTASARRRR